MITLRELSKLSVAQTQQIVQAYANAMRDAGMLDDRQVADIQRYFIRQAFDRDQDSPAAMRTWVKMREGGSDEDRAAFENWEDWRSVLGGDAQRSETTMRKDEAAAYAKVVRYAKGDLYDKGVIDSGVYAWIEEQLDPHTFRTDAERMGLLQEPAPDPDGVVDLDARPSLPDDPQTHQRFAEHFSAQHRLQQRGDTPRDEIFGGAPQDDTAEWIEDRNRALARNRDVLQAEQGRDHPMSVARGPHMPGEGAGAGGGHGAAADVA